jgi:hypothetical protein
MRITCVYKQQIYLLLSFANIVLKFWACAQTDISYFQKEKEPLFRLHFPLFYLQIYLLYDLILLSFVSNFFVLTCCSII